MTRFYLPRCRVLHRWAYSEDGLGRECVKCKGRQVWITALFGGWTWDYT